MVAGNTATASICVRIAVGLIVLGADSLTPAPIAATHAAQSRASHTLYVSAAGRHPGNGSRHAPFNSLARVERASSRGDRIVVLSSPRSLPPLDGGIRLKAGQKLIGAGAAPRITNTHAARHSGDAVRLANRVTVRNLEIVGARRGGIYGKNVSGATIRGNDVSAHNASCTPGFHIPPFVVPTTVPGAGIPISDGLHNGWAGIMVDAGRGVGRVRIVNNRVHDAECGDGIDVRLRGAASLRAVIARNVVRDLRQGPGFESLLAIGLQTRARSALVANLDRNVQTNLGNEEDVGAGPEGADSEGIFVNPVGPSRMRVDINRNAYTNPRGLGGFSANGLEFVSMADGSRARVVVRNSTFSGTPGDVLEQLGLGTNSRLTMKLVDVIAARSTGHAGSGYGNTFLIPGNNADCLLSASGGAGNVVELTIRDSQLTDCANNGLTFGSAVANGEGATARLELDIKDTEITGNRGANLRVGNLSDLEMLSVKVESSNLSDAQGTGSDMANVTFEEQGTTDRSVIDLGGGPLGAAGRNCFAGGTLAAEVLGYDVSARNNWWGSPGGPAPGRTVVAGGTLEHADALESPPPGIC